MTQELLFGMALGLQAPWYISKIEFNTSDTNSTRELHIWIDFTTGAKFKMEDNEDYSAYDSIQRRWRHLNFFQHECYLHARVPRVKMKDGSTLMVPVPWARAGSSFTLLFEAFALSLVKNEMSIAKAGKQLNQDGRVIGRIINWYVSLGLHQTPFEQPEVLCIDETAIKKGHNYITVVSDLVRKKVLAVSLGKDKEAVGSAVNQLKSKGMDIDEVKVLNMDLSPAYISAAGEYLPKSEIVFDRFHLDKLLNEAIDQLRKSEQHECTLLKKTKYLWLRNASTLSPKQSSEVEYLTKIYPKMGDAYRLKLQYKEIWNTINSRDEAEKAIKLWLTMVEKSNIFPLQKFANTIKSHWSGIIAYFNKNTTNAFAESINLKIQEAKRRARGYRNINHYITMILFLCGGLNMNYPHKTA